MSMQSDIGNGSENELLGDNRGLRDEFEANGFSILKNAIPSDCIQKLHGAALIHAEYIFELMRANGHQSHDNSSMNVGVKNGFREIVLRCPGRYEMSIQNRHWNAVPELIDPPYKACDIPPEHLEQKLMQLSILGRQIQENLLQTGPGKRLIQLAKDILRRGGEGDDDIYTCNISVVIAEPGAAEQKWHADGGHLSVWKHLPCHCLNIFLPLVDITEELGPTELRSGSHFLTRDLTRMMIAAKARKELRPPCLPLLDVGDALLFDYRILHRGRANLSKTQSRPILIITLAKKNFKDILNYPHRSILDET